MNKEYTSKQECLRNLPPVDTVLDSAEARFLTNQYARGVVVAAVQRILESRRAKIKSLPEPVRLDADWVSTISGKEMRHEIEMLCRPSLRRVINATGTVIHTNLGRAPLSPDALKAVMDTAGHYCNLEYNLAQGTRGSRQEHMEALIAGIAGAEAGFAVNNNAAAVLLVLSALAAGRSVIVSRGELMEIGGSFRIPDIMAQSGAVLREVGTTNRTGVHDYESAITDDTALIFKAHPSNYRIVGFTEEARVSALSALGRRYRLPVVVDLGSGTFIDPCTPGAADEPTAVQIIKAGADIVTFSGDKLLGGPQAGIIAGRKAVVDLCKKNPLARAVRIDKIRLAALEATMRSYRFGNDRISEIPVVAMLSRDETTLKRMAQRVCRSVNKQVAGGICSVCRDTSCVGGGSCPLHELPTWAVAIAPPDAEANAVEAALRNADTPVIARISRGRVLLDMRTVASDEIPLLVQSVTAACKDFSTVTSGNRSPEMP